MQDQTRLAKSMYYFFYLQQKVNWFYYKFVVVYG
jgi:hypothetical protein